MLKGKLYCPSFSIFTKLFSLEHVHQKFNAGYLSFTGLWGLVNNAGVWYFSEIEMTSDSLLRKVLETNILGAISLTRALLPPVRQAKGRIVNISSLLGELRWEMYTFLFADCVIFQVYTHVIIVKNIIYI